jgi:23S rRNA pseudouridine1911/1915/1917 synthase
MRKFKAGVNDSGKRADVFIAAQYPSFSRSSLEKLFDRDMVLLNNESVKGGYKLKGGEIFVVDETKLKQKPGKLELPVIYEDQDVVVIDKPEGVLTHSKGALNEEPTVASFIAPLIKDAELTGNRAGIVHRLDRWTSGVIIGAKTSVALSKLQKQFAQRRTKKTYLGIVEGAPEESEAIINVPIERNPKRPQTFRAGANGKSAVTEYKVLKTFEKGGKEYSLVEMKPETGRTHQLRVHMAYINHPIVGDRVYGQEDAHLYLHARSLEITLPSSERRIFEAEPPDYFKEFSRV